MQTSGFGLCIIYPNYLSCFKVVSEPGQRNSFSKRLFEPQNTAYICPKLNAYKPSHIQVLDYIKSVAGIVIIGSATGSKRIAENKDIFLKRQFVLVFKPIQAHSVDLGT